MRLRDFNDSDLADALVEQNVLALSAAERALKASLSSGTPFERTLLELGLASEEQIFQAIANWLEMPFLKADQIDPQLLRAAQLDQAFLERAEIIPAGETAEGAILVATSNPRAHDALQTLAFHLNQPIQAAIATRSTLRRTITAAFEEPATDSPTANSSGNEAADVERLRILSNEGPIIALTNDLLAQAVSERASDVHIEVLEQSGRVRYRVDGVLKIARHLSLEDASMITSRLKVMAHLNISEKRRPQDGRTKIAVQGRNIDLRLSTLPSQHGESVVVRILDQERVDLNWATLGFSPEQTAHIERIIKQPNGIFLVAGPTGSGKTTTLYTALSSINSHERKIITVEDPIEYALDGLTQVQVRPEIEMTFSNALRAILRQDPDVILVGEIRDKETAEIAVRAALVGRLVLSTVHTNDSLSAIDRLLDLGVPNYLLAATLRGVLSQRLLRKTCQACHGEGCALCDHSGLKGRTVVSELMRISQSAAHELSSIRSASELSAHSPIREFQSMAQTAEHLLNQGGTSKEEVLRIHAQSQ